MKWLDTIPEMFISSMEILIGWLWSGKLWELKLTWVENDFSSSELRNRRFESPFQYVNHTKKSSRHKFYHNFLFNLLNLNWILKKQEFCRVHNDLLNWKWAHFRCKLQNYLFIFNDHNIKFEHKMKKTGWKRKRVKGI